LNNKDTVTSVPFSNLSMQLHNHVR